jgi:hypothetical protein
VNDNKKVAAAGQVTGYKNPPAKTRFQKGCSGNPKGRPKQSRNLASVLSDVLNQPVTLNIGGQSRQVSKGEALNKLMLNLASKGERPAVNAVIELLGKVERLVEPPEEEDNTGVMVVPGVAKSIEEWRENVAKWHRLQRLEDEQFRYDCPSIQAAVRLWRDHIMRFKGKPEGERAAVEFKKITTSLPYLRNPYITRQSYPSEQEGESYRRKLKALEQAKQAVRDAKNQAPEQQLTAAKALEEAEKEFEKPYHAGQPARR